MKEPENLKQSIENQEVYFIADIISSGLIKLSSQTGEIIYANDIFFELNETNKEEYMERYHNCLLEQMDKETVKNIKQKIKESISECSPLSFYYQIETSEKILKSLHLLGKPIPCENLKKSLVFLCIVEDITEQKLSKKPYLLEQLETGILTKLIGALFWEYDILEKTLYRYGSLSETYSTEKVITNYVDTILTNDYIHKDDKETFCHFFESLGVGRKNKASIIRYKNNLGLYNYYQLQGTVLFDNYNVPIRIFGTTIDMGRQEKQETISSPLMKKSEFVKKINEYLKIYQNDSIRHSLILIEIDNYSTLRRTHGKTLLENIMIEAVIELKNVFSEQILSQLSPTTLGVFYYNIINNEDFINQLLQYNTVISQLYTNPSTFSLTCSMGIALENGSSTYDLLHRKAEIALSTVQKKGGGFFDFYGHSKVLQTTNKNPTPFEKTIKDSPDLCFLHHTLTFLESDEIENTIYQYLVQTCQYFNGNHAYIMLKNQVSQRLYAAYQYSTPNCNCDISSLYQYPFDLVNDYIELFDSNNLYLCHNIDEIESISPVLADGYRLAGVTSFLQYALYENNYCIGFLGIDICSNEFKIQNSQIASFYFLGRFLSHQLKNLHRKHCMALPYNRDKLTGLLSYQEFFIQGKSIIRKNPTKKFAIISCNINGFKIYNENFGIEIGNKILENYAHTLLLSLKENELCTRISADQFALLLNYDDSENDLFSRLIIRSNSGLYSTQQSPDYYRYDIIYGICFLSKNTDLTDAFQKATYARKSLKGYTGSHYAVYNKELEQKEKKLLTFRKSMKNGLTNTQFLPYYQPRYSLVTNEVIGFEALARWMYASETLKYPKDFLSIMKEDYDTIELDFQIIQAVCKDLNTAMKQSKQIYPISINLSMAHLMTTNFTERLLQLIHYYQIPLSYLILEITEDFLIPLQTEVSYFISKLKDLGFSIVIDDFNNHYSSLDILHDTNIDGINLDMTFLKNDIHSTKDEIILKSMIELVKALNIPIHVKKLENKKHIEYLTTLGCETAQGFAYSKALPFEDILETYFIQDKSS